MSYPTEIELEVGSEEYKRLFKHSELFRNLAELSDDPNAVTLSADHLFGGDQTKWELFLDLFFPEDAKRRVFIPNAKTLRVDPARGNLETVRELLDYLLVNEPATMMNFARNMSKRAFNAPQEIAPRGKGTRKAYVAPGPPRNDNLNNNWHNPYGNYYNPPNYESKYVPGLNNYYNNYNNTNNSNNSNVRVGYTEEEEKYLGKLKGRNAAKYYQNAGNKRKGHNRKTRRHRSTKK